MDGPDGVLRVLHAALQPLHAGGAWKAFSTSAKRRLGLQAGMGQQNVLTGETAEHSTHGWGMTDNAALIIWGHDREDAIVAE